MLYEVKVMGNNKKLFFFKFENWSPKPKRGFYLTNKTLVFDSCHERTAGLIHEESGAQAS